MRLDDNTLVLSEKNLLSLLSKLYTKGSAATIAGPDDCPMYVKAEPDSVHYGNRDFPAGEMHPVTERILEAVKAIAKDHQI